MNPAAQSAAVTVRQFERSDTESVIQLWEACELTRPWNDPYLDIERKLRVQPELFLVAEINTDTDSPTIIGSIMGGYDGHRGWMYYLAVASAHRGNGLGRQLVAETENLLGAMGCPKSQLMVRTENAVAIDFYLRLGYEHAAVSTLGKRLDTAD